MSEPNREAPRPDAAWEHRRLEYELREDDLRAYFRWHFRSSPAMRRLLFVLLALAGGAALFTAVVGVLRGEWVEPVVSVVIPACALLVLYPAMSRLTAAQVARQVTRQPAFRPHQTLEVSPEGLVTATAGGTTERPWSEVRRIVQAADHLFFILSLEQAVVVPRRAFADRLASESFEGLVRMLHTRALEYPSSAPPPREPRLPQAVPDDSPTVAVTLDQRCHRLPEPRLPQGAAQAASAAVGRAGTGRLGDNRDDRGF